MKKGVQPRESWEAYFMWALREGKRGELYAPANFGKWFDEARRRGLVQASMMVDGVQMVCMTTGEWVSYEKARLIL